MWEESYRAAEKKKNMRMLRPSPLPPPPQKPPPPPSLSAPKKKKQNKKHMPFNENPSDQLDSSTTSDFRVSIESHAGSSKATQSFSFLSMHDLPNHRILTAAAIIILLQVAKKLTNEAPFPHFT